VSFVLPVRQVFVAARCVDDEPLDKKYLMNRIMMKDLHTCISSLRMPCVHRDGNHAGADGPTRLDEARTGSRRTCTADFAREVSPMTTSIRARRLLAGAAATGLLAGGAALGMSGTAVAAPTPTSTTSVVNSGHHNRCEWVKGHWQHKWVKGHWEKKWFDHGTWHKGHRDMNGNWHPGHWSHHHGFKWVYVPAHWEKVWVKGHWDCHDHDH
jgi:hypothetical protein